MLLVRRVLFGILIAFVFLVLLGWVLQLFEHARVSKYISASDTIRFVNGAYSLNSGALVPSEAEMIGDVRILESVTTKDKEIVLAEVPATEGTVLGIVQGDTFTPLLSDGTHKYALSVTGKGEVVFGTGTFIPSFVLPKDVLSVSTGEEVIESVSSDTSTINQVTQSDDRIMKYNLETAVLKDLGDGTSPRIMRGDAGIITLTSDGVTKIDLSSGVRTTLLAYGAADLFRSGISPDGLTVVLKSSVDSFFDVFTLTAPEPKRLGIIAPGSGIEGIAFLDSQHFLLRFAKDSAGLYEIPSDESPSGRIIGSPLTIR